jgi:hypothetical protein
MLYEDNVLARLFFGDLNHFTALVLAAMRAGAVGQLGLMAVGALGFSERGQMVVGPPGGGPFLRVSAFRIGHFVL